MFSDMSWYACHPLKTHDKEAVSTILTEWANKQGLYYRVSFPVYDDSFKKRTFIS